VTAVAAGREPVDARADRVVQGTIAVLTLGAFVFRVRWMLPVLAVVLGVGAAIGPARNPLHLLFRAGVASRLPAARATVPASTLQVQDALAVGLLGLATLFLLVGLPGLAWVVALAEAAVAAVAATTGVHVAVSVRDRLKRR
jgi:hypothetical protein